MPCRIIYVTIEKSVASQFSVFMSEGEHYESKSDSLFHILVPVFDLKCHIFYISISIFSASAGRVRYDINMGNMCI